MLMAGMGVLIARSNILIWDICKDILLLSMRRRDLQTQYKSFCSVLRTFRREKGLNQVDIAKKLRKHQSYISKVESGERRLDFVELAQLCNAMGISIVDFAKAFDKLAK
jgi:ribosome-binding protein aMBF1 (putative translation factor)